jgi:hypothetical protein
VPSAHDVVRLVVVDRGMPPGSAAKVLILLSLAWRIVDRQNEQAIVTKITRRVFLACAYLTGGDAPDWRGAAVDYDVTGAA